MAIQVGLKRTYWVSVPSETLPEDVHGRSWSGHWLDDEQYARERHAENIEDGDKYTLYRIEVVVYPEQ